MKNTRKWIALTMLLCLCLPAVGQAACTLDARMTDRGLVIAWEGSSAGTITLYRDGWPVLVVCAPGKSGSYTVPAAYTARAGSYKVRLRCGGSCVTVPVHAETGAAQPTTSPTQPAPKPTEQPAAQPTQKPAPQPTPQPTAKPTAAPAQGSASLAEEMIALVNADRAANGLGAVAQDAALTRAACVRAQEIVAQFSHTRPDGSSWSTVYSGAYAENIAKGYATAEKCEAAFMSSQGHRENILRAGYTKIGVCAYTTGGVTYWVQLFGK